VFGKASKVSFCGRLPSSLSHSDYLCRSIPLVGKRSHADRLGKIPGIAQCAAIDHDAHVFKDARRLCLQSGEDQGNSLAAAARDQEASIIGTWRRRKMNTRGGRPKARSTSSMRLATAKNSGPETR
jgi:hypothetical protein